MASKTSALQAALVGAMSPESDVTAPISRPRNYSFTSAIASMEVGDMPAARVVKIDSDLTIDEAIASMTEASNKFRDSVNSSVSQAKRRHPGFDYSIEVADIKLKSGLYLVALVHRVV